MYLVFGIYPDTALFSLRYPPPFNHPNLAMRMKLPYDGLPKPRMFPLYFHLDANIGNKNSCGKYVAVQGAASQVYLHSITSQRMNERLTNISIHSLTYAMHVDINPCCWCRLCGMMVVRMLGRQRCMKRCRNFSKGCQ